MQNSKRMAGLWLIAVFVLGPAAALENGSDDWVLSGTTKPSPERRLGPANPREFAHIRESANDNTPSFAVDINAALITAAAQNDLQGVEMLLKNGADANANDVLGNRPLLHASRLGSAEMVRILLEAGADPNAKGMGYTALGLAALNGYAQVADWLLQFGAYVEKRSDNDLTPLMNAALLNNVTTIQVLLRYDAVVDRENNAGRTALSYAAEGGAEQVIGLLLARGADINAVDKKFNTPLFWASLRDQRSAVRLLLRRGADQGAVSLDLL